MKAENDVVVVGGGIAGLAAAAYLARSGASVCLLEKAAAPGGRAQTRERQGHHLNLGPHALFRHGAAVRALQELGVPWQGHAPATTHAFALDGGASHSLVGLLGLRLLDLRAKLDLGRFLSQLPWISGDRLAGIPLAAWLDEQDYRPVVRRLVEALVRVSSYANAPDRQSAGAALVQLRLGLQGVLYLDGGWQTLTDGLRRAAQTAGARIVTGARVRAVESAAGRVTLQAGVHSTTARAAVLAVPPGAAADLTGSALARRVADRAIPVRLACLDLALSAPIGPTTFALGLDQPVYASLHSAAARLAPQGEALWHLARYLVPGETGTEAELHALADQVLPGWRDRLHFQRLMPALVVAYDMPAAEHGGLSGRPGPALPDADGVFVCGDWVGAEGHLADAALASARAAAGSALARMRGQVAA